VDFPIDILHICGEMVAVNKPPSIPAHPVGAFRVSPLHYYDKFLALFGKVWESPTVMYSETSEKTTIWGQYKIEPFCPLFRGCPLSDVVNLLFLVQKEILGFFRMSLVER